MPTYNKYSGHLKSTRRKAFSDWFTKTFLLEKLGNKFGLGLFLFFAALVAFGISKSGIVFGVLFLAAVMAPPIIYGIFSIPIFAITLQLTVAYFLFLILRIGIDAPVGTALDAFQAMLLITIIARQKKENNWQIFKTPVTNVIFMWLGFNLIEVANPSAPTLNQWLYTVRTVALVQLSFFIFVYYIRDIKFIRYLMVLYLVYTIAGALYGLKQEFIGFSDGEWAYLNSDPEIASLLFIAGHWRKFSFFSDPVAFAYNMSMPVILCISLIAGKFKAWIKIVSFLLIILFFTSGLTSGTRGANVLVPAALIMFAILNFNRKVLIFSIFITFFFAILIKIPTSNQNLLRFQTAFNPSNDASYNLRKINQKRIQPYILTHPMGGGLGSTGAWGQRFAPNSYLAHFAPDSGYIRVAVENGWIGLFIFCVMMFTFMKTGIDNFYSIKDPELKTYCMASLLIIFAYNIANFPQEALVQYPSNLLFYLFVALTIVTKRLDDEKTANQNKLEAKLAEKAAEKQALNEDEDLALV
ncbi:O-antigen ligase family protein [Mucilaginibacter ginkgonis]|uniref:O-antigen ligase family protein n=1 Tax=Mucilaginibacter ginkgonis TaxID=2682091 RepID=A0A6I4I222_9SPHI|nr:O-antigen ligase family protein [Mucilaginibacter ginkgonis]QQL50882.1 O-antigen ligase family protein [Mucilaginibacter ginkgonis]